MSRRRPPIDTTRPCGVCGQPVDAAFVCRDCMDGYHGALARVPATARDLRIELTRQAVKGGGVAGRGSAEPPMPYVEAASRALDALRAALVTACRVLALDQPLPADRIGAMCAWLARRESSIPLRPEGPDIVAELTKAMRRAVRVCDNPPEQVLRGRCPCDAELRSEPGQRIVTCAGCGTHWDGQQLDQLLDDAVRDHLAPWSEVEGWAVDVLRIPRSTLDSWRRRGAITEQAGGLYRMDDLLRLDAQRKTRREAG